MIKLFLWFWILIFYLGAIYLNNLAVFKEKKCKIT